MSAIKETLTEPITLTDGAVKQLQLIREQQGLDPEHGLRVGVKGGGCSGFSYILGFDKQTEKDDTFVCTNDNTCSPVMSLSSLPTCELKINSSHPTSKDPYALMTSFANCSAE